MVLAKVLLTVAVFFGGSTPPLYSREQCVGSRSLLLLVDSSQNMARYGVMEKLQLAIRELIPALDESLRLSVIRFDSTQQVMIDGLAMDEAGKRAAADKLQSLAAGGESELGIALDVVAKRLKKPSPCNQILLITDGTLPDDGGALQSKVAALHERGPVLSALLISATRDYTTFKALIRSGGGELSQVRTAEQILGGLKGMLRRMGALS